MLVDNAQALIRAAAEVLKVDAEDIVGKRRKQAEVLARQMVMAIWSDSHSLQDSSEVVGRTNHTVAHYARRVIYDKLQYCEATKERMRKILKRYAEITNESAQ
jgi:chromosomal replication initiation ATPase DnaA